MKDRYSERMSAPIQRATTKICELRAEMDKLHPLSEHDIENCIVDFAAAKELLRVMYEECAYGRPSVETLATVKWFLTKVRALPPTAND